MIAGDAGQMLLAGDQAARRQAEQTLLPQGAVNGLVVLVARLQKHRLAGLHVVGSDAVTAQVKLAKSLGAELAVIADGEGLWAGILDDRGGCTGQAQGRAQKK